MAFYAGSSRGRTPGSGPGNRGSNPCPAASNMRPWLNWIERLATDQKVGGSSPPGRTFPLIGDFFMARSSSGLGRWPLTPVTRVRPPYALLFFLISF